MTTRGQASTRGPSTHVLHGDVPNVFRVLADALQKVLEISHGSILDGVAQRGDGLTHGLQEFVLADPGQVGVFQLLKGLQSRVVSEEA